MIRSHLCWETLVLIIANLTRSFPCQLQQGTSKFLAYSISSQNQLFAFYWHNYAWSGLFADYCTRLFHYYIGLHVEVPTSGCNINNARFYSNFKLLKVTHNPSYRRTHLRHPDTPRGVFPDKRDHPRWQQQRITSPFAPADRFTTVTCVREKTSNIMKGPKWSGDDRNAPPASSTGVTPPHSDTHEQTCVL